MISSLSPLWDMALWKCVSPVPRGLILMSNNQVVDHQCFLKKHLYQKGEMWRTAKGKPKWSQYC